MRGRRVDRRQGGGGAREATAPAQSNVAVTFLAVSIVTVHAPVPEHAPLHPANVDEPAAFAVRCTTVSTFRSREQVTPQSTPTSVFTVPLPAPDLVTVSGNEPTELMFTCGVLV